MSVMHFTQAMTCVGHGRAMCRRGEACPPNPGGWEGSQPMTAAQATWIGWMYEKAIEQPKGQPA